MTVLWKKPIENVRTKRTANRREIYSLRFFALHKGPYHIRCIGTIALLHQTVCNFRLGYNILQNWPNPPQLSETAPSAYCRCGNTLISTVHSAGSCNFCFHPGQADCFYRKTILRCVSSFSAAQAAAGRRLSAISMVSVFKFFGKQPAVSQFKKVHIVEASHLPVCVSTRTAFA